jgi:hypothetical protein
VSAATYERSWTQDGRPALNRRGIPAVDGPWMAEPDKVHWIDPATDMDCLAVRNPMGAWCGYVGLPPGHPWHGVNYSGCAQRSAACDEDWAYCDHSPDAQVTVHGGLTFADRCGESEKGEGYGICHVPLPGRPHDVWWLGFDCNHAGDMSPYDAAQAEHYNHRWPYGLIDGDRYRDLAYVKAETASLARQIAAVSR